MELGAQLQAARTACRMTQEEVAAGMFVTRQTVSRWEQNKTIPNIYVLQDLSKLYGVSVDELLTAPGQNPEPVPSATPDSEDGEEHMQKINWIALFGVICFNVVLFSSVAITAVALLFSLWVVVGAFIISPVLLMAVNLLGLQDYSLVQSLLSVALCLAGLVMFPLAMRLSQAMVGFFKKYYYYNLRAVITTDGQN